MSSYPSFRSFEIGICNECAGAEFMLSPSISVVPMVNLCSNSISGSLRKYFETQDIFNQGFVSLRVSSRKNVSFGIGMRESFFSPCFGLAYNYNNHTTKPFISIGWTFGE